MDALVYCLRHIYSMLYVCVFSNCVVYMCLKIMQCREVLDLESGILKHGSYSHVRVVSKWWAANSCFPRGLIEGFCSYIHSAAESNWHERQHVRHGVSRDEKAPTSASVETCARMFSIINLLRPQCPSVRPCVLRSYTKMLKCFCLTTTCKKEPSADTQKGVAALDSEVV
jgi:hypothetical protein